jgi:hypothetical protein
MNTTSMTKFSLDLLTFILTSLSLKVKWKNIISKESHKKIKEICLKSLEKLVFANYTLAMVQEQEVSLNQLVCSVSSEKMISTKLTLKLWLKN